MNWYLAKLVFQVQSGDGNHTPQFDEQVRLIWADEVSWAYEKASVIGWLEQRNFHNVKNERVEWKFIDVAEIHPISTPEDGLLLCSSTEEPEHATAYIELVKTRAQKSLYIARAKESAGLLVRE